MSRLLDSREPARPVVLVMDDLQWAAAVAVQLLSHLLRDDERGQLMVLATARDTEPSEHLATLLTDLRREHRLDLVALRGLDARRTAALGAARGEGVRVAQLHETTEGNPFYIEELVRHVVELGGGTADQALTSLPDSVRDTIARRLLRLPASTRRVLGVAAVAGRGFRLDVVAHAAGIDIDSADDALDPAVSAGIVSDHGQPTGELRVHPALIHAVSRDGLGAARRARVHRHFGHALEELGGDPGEIARHLLAAAEDGSDVTPGIEMALLAAGEAEQRYIYDDAIAVLEPAWAAAVSAMTCQPTWCAGLRSRWASHSGAPGPTSRGPR
ncbi:MAG: hypothetical protein M5U19_07330 [Microthrixaceae bacterium]|nr:hypothetical protein [Microthrixaceae bacterium]